MKPTVGLVVSAPMTNVSCVESYLKQLQVQLQRSRAATKEAYKTFLLNRNQIVAIDICVNTLTACLQS